MTTPADWYPDPEDPAGLRYWDGSRWTEHRTPAAPPPSPVEPPAAVPEAFISPDYNPDPTPDEPHGAHRVPDKGQEPVSQAYTPTPSQPYDTHPRTSYEAQPWDSPPAEQPSYAPTPGPLGPPGGGLNKKLVFGIIGAGVAILLAIVVVLVVVLVRKDDSTTTAAPVTSFSETASSTVSPSETTPQTGTSATETPPPAGAEGSDGDFTFAVASTETGDTITSTVGDDTETTADGMYYVIHLNVTNTGTAPITFVSTFQQLNAAGQTFPLDDEGTAFLDGTTATIDPGDQIETSLVYDVPVGTEPDSILVRADPSTAGVELPLR